MAHLNIVSCWSPKNCVDERPCICDCTCVRWPAARVPHPAADSKSITQSCTISKCCDGPYLFVHCRHDCVHSGRYNAIRLPIQDYVDFLSSVRAYFSHADPTALFPAAELADKHNRGSAMLPGWGHRQRIVLRKEYASLSQEFRDKWLHTTKQLVTKKQRSGRHWSCKRQLRWK